MKASLFCLSSFTSLKKSPGHRYQRLDSELDKKCSDINLLPGQDVLVEEKDDNGEFSNESAISPFESVLPSPLSPSGFMPDMEGASNQVSTDESDNGRGAYTPSICTFCCVQKRKS